MTPTSSHFTSFSRLFPPAVLEEEVLPQLRLGMRDADDAMVAATLRALADLVPLLGARIVVSRNRRDRMMIDCGDCI